MQQCYTIILYSVVNLSQHILTSDQHSLLTRGLNFCPTPGESNPGEQRSDLDILHHRLHLKYRFNGDEEDLTLYNEDSNFQSEEAFAHRKFREKSSYNPTGAPALEAMILNNEHQFNQRPMFSPPKIHNLNVGERMAIFELKNLNNIIIQKADKGSATVLQDKEAYIAEGNSFFVFLYNFYCTWVKEQAMYMIPIVA
jgi:hypothetical protein